MKRNHISIVVMCFIIASVMVVQVSASARSYFGGCEEPGCNGNVVAYCDGPVSDSPRDATHEYGGILFWGKEICAYEEHEHSTTEYCLTDPTHVHSGDNVFAAVGHEGKDVCGYDDVSPCGMHQVAYRSGQ